MTTANLPSRTGAFDSIAVDELRGAFTPRLGAWDHKHVRRLAERYEALPPIVVHRPTMAVVDGVHRLAAARSLGHSSVGVRFFDGSEAEAYVEAVRANTAHGKPLALTERRAAAKRILELCPDWSDRRVAEVCGLSHKTVGALRRHLGGEFPHLRARVGRDGRSRPVDAAASRLCLADLVHEFPTASLRSLAAKAGTSQATALDVRQRVQRGKSPLPPRYRSAPVLEGRKTGRVDHTVRSFQDDGALTSTSAGRAFVQWFDTHRVSEEDALRHLDQVPLSRVYTVADEARRQAAIWQKVACLLDARAARHGSR